MFRALTQPTNIRYLLRYWHNTQHLPISNGTAFEPLGLMMARVRLVGEAASMPAAEESTMMMKTMAVGTSADQVRYIRRGTLVEPGVGMSGLVTMKGNRTIKIIWGI